ncbi:MAG: hypothetical protein ACREMY_25425, partial [bacterium]
MWSQHGTARISAIGGVLAVLLATVGCTAQVGNGPIAPTTPAASQTSFGSVTPKSAAPSISNEAEGPISYSPDNMWGFLATAPGEVRRADDLAGAVAFSRLVVVGRYVGVEKGPGYGPAGGGIGWYA